MKSSQRLRQGRSACRIWMCWLGLRRMTASCFRTTSAQCRTFLSIPGATTTWQALPRRDASAAEPGDQHIHRRGAGNLGTQCARGVERPAHSSAALKHDPRWNHVWCSRRFQPTRHAAAPIACVGLHPAVPCFLQWPTSCSKTSTIISRGTCSRQGTLLSSQLARERCQGERER